MKAITSRSVKNGSDRNYVRRAHHELNDGNPRLALLTSCRQALENLSTRVWKALVKKDEALGSLKLILRGPGSEPWLRNLIDSLYKAIQSGVENGRLDGAAWAQRKEAFQEILDVPETALAWKYLNKAVHDGDGEDSRRLESSSKSWRR